MVNNMSYVNPLLYFAFLLPGNQHLKQVAVCNCESHAVTLVRANIWPGSPDKLSIGFHFKLMDLAETLFLHNQVPLKDFSSSITSYTFKCLVNIYMCVKNVDCKILLLHVKC